jgi:hypothetical protein
MLGEALFAGTKGANAAMICNVVGEVLAIARTKL